nr:TetR/AcrR family transcriptional regulator [Rhabdothermincola salaria]
MFGAFAELLYEQGYDAISLADVAARAGVSRTSVYNYFSDKDALVVAYADHESTAYAGALRAELEEIDNPVDRLRALIASQLRYFASHHLPPGRDLRVAISPAAYQRVAQHAVVLEGILRQVLREAVAEGYLPDDDVEGAMPLVTACIDRGAAEDRDPDALTESIEVTTTFVLRALGVRLGPSGRPRRVAPRPGA